MNRRQALSRTALILGVAVVGTDVFLSGCKAPEKKTALFSEDDILFLDEVGETILPDTPSSPGAKAARIGNFMKTIVTDCYNEAEVEIFTRGIQTINENSKSRFNKDFILLSASEKRSLLTAINKEANIYNGNKKSDQPGHYFTMMKELTLWGYFTSEPGETKALRYLPVPGKYIGCVPYNGEKAWAL